MTSTTTAASATAPLNLQLRNIQCSLSLSEETMAYTASLYLDGRKVAEVSNHGTGGCDDQRWLDKSAEPIITAWFAAQPERDTGMLVHGEPFFMRDDLESWCQDQVATYTDLKRIKSAARRKVIGLFEGKELQFKFPPAQLPRAREQVLARYPGMRFLHEMSDDELLAVLKNARMA